MFKFMLPFGLCLATLAVSAAARPAEASPAAPASARPVESDTTKGPYATEQLAIQWRDYYIASGWKQSDSEHNFNDGYWYVYLVR
jgi:hypothetical protein